MQVRVAKPIVFNILGTILGLTVSIIAYHIACWIFLFLIPKIPFIPAILSWPVDYEWYALTGIICADIFSGVTLCSYFCNLCETKYNYGVIVLSVINFARYAFDFINAISTNGFSFSMLLPYGFALGAIYITFSSGIERE